MSSGVIVTGLGLPVPDPVLLVTAGAAKVLVVNVRRVHAAKAAFGRNIF